jgi:hypothetical protein
MMGFASFNPSYLLIHFLTHRAHPGITFAIYCGPAMSDLEFRRALSPGQMREALSLLDGSARAKPRNVQVGDLSPAKEAGSGGDQASPATAMPNRLPAAEDAHQRRKHLNPVLAFYGLGIAAAAALTLLSWSERALAPPTPPGIASEQLPNPQPAQPLKSAAPVFAANAPPDQSSGGAERGLPKPEVAASSPGGHGNRDDNQAAAKNAANSTNAIPYAWEERASRKPKEEGWWHTRAVRAAEAKKRFWRRHWLARAEINRGKCFFFVCLPWQTQRIVYQPPRNITQ